MEKQLKQILVLTGILSLYGLVLLFYFLTPLNEALQNLTRIFALFGLLSLILSSIMAAFTREIFQIFGKPFKKVHHFIALFGFGLIIFHPIFLAIFKMNLNVFVPKFESWIGFWELAGRPAYYLIILAVLAGFLQNKIRKWWRYIHSFNYIAVVFGVIHGMLIGTNLSTSIGLKIIYITLLVATTAAFILKRYKNFKKKQRIKAKQEKQNRKEEELEM